MALSKHSIRDRLITQPTEKQNNGKRNNHNRSNKWRKIRTPHRRQGFNYYIQLKRMCRKFSHQTFNLGGLLKNERTRQIIPHPYRVSIHPRSPRSMDLLQDRRKERKPMNQNIFRIHFLNDQDGNKIRPKLIECNDIKEFQKKANKTLDRSKISWRRVWRTR